MKRTQTSRPMILAQRSCGLLTIVVLSMAAYRGTDPVYATTIVETFDNGSNQGGWNFPLYEPDGGNSGAYLRNRNGRGSIAP